MESRWTAGVVWCSRLVETLTQFLWQGTLITRIAIGVSYGVRQSGAALGAISRQAHPSSRIHHPTGADAHVGVRSRRTSLLAMLVVVAIGVTATGQLQARADDPDKQPAKTGTGDSPPHLLATGGHAATAPTTDVRQGRILRFPSDRTLGLVKTRPKGSDASRYSGWETLAEARGAVVVPSGVDVRLQVSDTGSADLSPLRNLEPNALNSLMCWRTSLTDDQLPHIAHLTGLRELSLGYTNITSAGLIHIKNLTSLDYLRLTRTKVDDQGLAYVTGLKSLKDLDLTQTDITDGGLTDVAQLKRLEDLSLGYTDITDAGLRHIGGLTSLRRLYLDKNSITDKGLASLSGLKELEDLLLMNLHITSRGLVHLKNLKKLKSLRMDGAKIDDEGLAHLSGLESLETLFLPFQSSVTDEGLKAIATLPALRSLSNLPEGITDAGVAALTSSRSIEELHVTGKGITDAGMRELAGMTQLRELWVQLCPVTDAGLGALTALKNLEYLMLNRTQVTSAGLTTLARLPKLKTLSINGVDYGDNGLAWLKGLDGVESLDLGGTRLRDDDLAHVGRLTSLKRLEFNGETISDGGFAHLRTLTSLETLRAWGSMLTDDGLAHVAGMTKLGNLVVSGAFTDAGLQHLEGLSELYRLQLTGDDLTQAGLDRLRAKLPALQPINARRSRDQGRRPEPGQVAPAFSVTTLDGKPLSLADYRGKVVLLHFWATWCSPCVASTPDLKKWYGELKQLGDFEMISISLDDQDYLPRRHAERYGLTWPQVCVGRKSDLQTNYGIRGVASYILIGRDGKVILSRERSWSKLKEAVARALGKT